MNDRQQIMFGFLGGTIIAVDNGYKVFPHPKPDKIYNRLSDAKWFLAVKWCDDLSSPAGIINNTGELAFLNRVVLEIGEERFIPQDDRLDIFTQCLSLQPNQTKTYTLASNSKTMEIQGLEIDPRYGKVALVREILD